MKKKKFLPGFHSLITYRTKCTLATCVLVWLANNDVQCFGLMQEETGEALILAKHNKGCHCKKSGCLKKYCECFQANILCSDNCKCLDCKNYEGSEERQALFHGDHANNMAYIQQAANAAITGAIGSSGYGSPPVSKKRKGQELFFGATVKDPLHRLGQFQQVTFFLGP